MCGIAGIVENKNNENLMNSMLDIIEHRGPDDKTVYQNSRYCIGHRRLSIIDVEGGAQPIFNEDKSLCVVLNGEIYNYRELKKDLVAKGHVFKTNSDTEVLVHLYEDYKEEFIEKLNGIFAFALYDINSEKLLIARDHFGVKPMHYYHQDDLLVFGSEQKSILLHPSVKRNINKQSLHFHLNLRYTQSDETLFEGVKRLLPGHFMIYQNGNFSIQQYYKLIPKVQKINEDEACEQMNFYLKQAIERQLVSDVPVGVYLSGGLDSSAIVQKMHELGVKDINTFTLGFNEPTDEFPDAKRIVEHFGTNHKELSLSLSPMQQFPEVLWHAEEPKINLLQGFNMSKFVHKDVKVILGGLGGDELFAGYDIHKFIYPFNKFMGIPKWMQNVLKIKSDLLFKIQNGTGTLRIDEYRRGAQMLLSIGNIEKFYLILRNVWDFDKGAYNNIYSQDYIKEISKLRKTVSEFEKYFSDVKDANALDKVLYSEFYTKMVNDYLLVDDRMSMANSVEERVPFLDKDLVEFGFSIPLELKIKNNKTKQLFRKAMEDKLPPKIINKKKWGFTVNPYLQFTKDLKGVAEKVLTEEFVRTQGIFNYDYIQKILNYKPSPKLRWHYNYLWIVLGIGIWQKMYIDSDKYLTKEIDLEKYYS
jgi:asparagine synthase (glutamine-hydrolysing)